MINKEKNKMTKSNKIRFISANKGGIELFSDPGVKIGYAKEPTKLAELIKVFGLGDDVYASSSMDFAKEDGFRTHDGARKLLNRAIRFHNKVVREIKRNTDPYTTVADIWYDYTN